MEAEVFEAGKAELLASIAQAEKTFYAAGYSRKRGHREAVLQFEDEIRRLEAIELTMKKEVEEVVV
jgi:hypothetical protein